MALPGRERIAAMLECIPPANREEVLEELLRFHYPKRIREQIRRAKQVQAVLESNEQPDLEIAPSTYPIQALVRREPGKFFAFETGGEEAEVVVLLIDKAFYENKDHVLRSGRDKWHVLVFETKDDFDRWLLIAESFGSVHDSGCWPSFLRALIFVLAVVLWLVVLVSRCNGVEDISNSDMGPTPTPDLVEKDDARELEPDMPDEADFHMPDMQQAKQVDGNNTTPKLIITSADCSGDDEKMCGERCVNIQKDPRHCGECARTCENGKACSFGICKCPEYKVGDECKGKADYDEIVSVNICTENSVLCSSKDLQFRYGEKEKVCKEVLVEIPDNVRAIRESTILDVHSSVSGIRNKYAHFKMTNFYTTFGPGLKVCGYYDASDGVEVDMRMGLSIGLRYKCRPDETLHNAKCCRAADRMLVNSNLDYRGPKCNQKIGDDRALSRCKDGFPWGFAFETRTKEEKGRWKIERLEGSMKQQRCRISGAFECRFKVWECAGTGPLSLGRPLEISNTIRESSLE